MLPTKYSHFELKRIVLQGRVVGKPLRSVNANPGLKIKRSIHFSWIKKCLHCRVVFGVDLDYSSSKLEDKQWKQETSPKSYKTEIKSSISLIGF